ncbi:hypothetical protein [Cohnella lupini]|nr:hypothetical protein [Cohnella lupini]
MNNEQRSQGLNNIGPQENANRQHCHQSWGQWGGLGLGGIGGGNKSCGHCGGRLGGQSNGRTGGRSEGGKN